MSSLDVNCPACKKSIQAGDDLRGQKVRCKGCGHVFVIPATAEFKLADGGTSPYAVVEPQHEPARCPICTHALDRDDADLCVHCGYNRRTGQKLVTRKVRDITLGQRCLWVLPGFLCLSGVFALLALDIYCWYGLPQHVRGSNVDFLGSRGAQIWIVALSLVVVAALGRFAFKRLIQEPNPPEKTDRWGYGDG